MVNIARRSLAILMLLFSCVATAQNIEISITDPEVAPGEMPELARGETLTLNIRVYDQRQGMQLDLTPLTEDFDVLGTRTSSQIRSINGAVESWTDYIVTLFPLNEGELTIPSLTINNTLTESITVNVINEGPRSNQNSDDLFLEIEVNKETVYVQEQLLFTVRLYYTINGIRNPQFTELEMPDTVIQLIGSPSQYEQPIDGVRYGVYEKRYVIFPQRSGDLEIPDILFRGEVTDGSSNFVFRNLNTRRVTAFIEGITIDVQERPAAARNSEFWLPVSDLVLEESWSNDINDLQIGDSVVRTVKMTAFGLDGAVLPPFSPTQVDGLNLYPDPPDIDRSFVDGSIVGTRSETMTLVPTTGGAIEIPEMAIPWWNITTDQAEVSVIPATRIEIASVQGAVPSEQAVASSGNLQELLARDPVVDQDMVDEQAQAEFIEVDAGWMNLAIGFAFVVVAFSIYSLVIAPNRQQISNYLGTQRQRVHNHYLPSNNERVAFQQLSQACKSQNLIRIRDSLIRWANHYFSDRSINSMEDILQQRQIPELHEYANQIQTALFNKGDAAPVTPDSRGLLQLLERVRREKRREAKQHARRARYELPPLYRS